MLSTLSDPSATIVGADSAGTIRPFAAPDAAAVADLLVRAFQNAERPAPAGMAAYLREVYLDAPWFDPELASRVMVRADGRITGFIGVSALPMRLDGKPIRTAVVSSLSVDPRFGEPTTGPRLLRDVRGGPQDAILSDRSNAVAVTLLRSLGAELIRGYSFDWVRTLRPAGLAVETLARRFGAARLLAPLAAPFDRAALGKSQRDTGPHWSAPGRSRAAEAFSDHDAGSDELLALIPRFLADFPLHPDWTHAALRTILADAARKSDLGAFTARVVLDPARRPAGLFLYHLKPGRVAHVLQILAARGREGIVLDRAIAHALAQGAVAIRGRSTPVLTDALMERRAIFVPELTTLVLSRNPDLVRHFQQGTAFFTGLAGENWMRLNGDSF